MGGIYKLDHIVRVEGVLMSCQRVRVALNNANVYTVVIVTHMPQWCVLRREIPQLHSAPMQVVVIKTVVSEAHPTFRTRLHVTTVGHNTVTPGLKRCATGSD